MNFEFRYTRKNGQADVWYCQTEQEAMDILCYLRNRRAKDIVLRRFADSIDIYNDAGFEKLPQIDLYTYDEVKRQRKLFSVL